MLRRRKYTRIFENHRIAVVNRRLRSPRISTDLSVKVKTRNRDISPGVRLLVQYGSTFKHGLFCEVAAPDKSNRCAALLGNLSGSLVWVVPPKRNRSANSTSSIVLLCVSDDAPLAFHYEYALACASCRPAALYSGGGTDFDALC